MKLKTKRIVITALMTSMVCVATMIIKIPSPMKGYFVYRGVAYGTGTKVRLKEHVHCPTYAYIVKNDIYVFYNGTQDGLYMFHWNDTIERPKHIKDLQKNIYNCDLDIEEIVEPVYPQWISWQQKAIQDISNKKVCADVFGGVLTYIVIMCIGAIFKDRLAIWLISTVIFSWWLLNQYRT